MGISQYDLLWVAKELTNNYRSDNLRLMFSKQRLNLIDRLRFLNFDSEKKQSLKAIILKRRTEQKENLVLQDVKKALSAANQKLIVMVRG